MGCCSLRSRAIAVAAYTMGEGVLRIVFAIPVFAIQALNELREVHMLAIASLTTGFIIVIAGCLLLTGILNGREQGLCVWLSISVILVMLELGLLFCGISLTFLNSDSNIQLGTMTVSADISSASMVGIGIITMDVLICIACMATIFSFHQSRIEEIGTKHGKPYKRHRMYPKSKLLDRVVRV